jgi:NAD(P)-dependent dehydrogenase (short-subunit alcohol dehydrogenase family)
MAKNVMILVGAGQIGLACARRLGYGMKIVVGDRSLQNAQEICSILNNAGFDAVSVEMDLSSRKSILSLIAEAQKYGDISMLINAAGVSPSQASIETILKVDLYGTAVLLEEVGTVSTVSLRASSSRRWPSTSSTDRAAISTRICSPNVR